ncbi:hypothetical protein Tco_1049417 [Tanacetum coccineum]
MRHSMRMLVKDTRSQDCIDDKDNDKGSKSRSQSMKEQAYNKEQRERPRPHELNDKSNLIDLIKDVIRDPTTPLSKLNEDECFNPGGDEIEACLTSDSIPPGIDGADFDPDGDILLLEKLISDDTSSPLPPKELYFADLKMIKSSIDTLPDFKDYYYDSEGDIIYLESFFIKDTTHTLPSEVFLDRDPRSLEDEPDKDDLKSIVKVFDPGIHKEIISSTYVRTKEFGCDVRRIASFLSRVSWLVFYVQDYQDCEDSCARGFVHRSLDL